MLKAEINEAFLSEDSLDGLFRDARSHGLIDQFKLLHLQEEVNFGLVVYLGTVQGQTVAIQFHLLDGLYLRQT